MREEIDTCGYCALRTFAGITVRSIQPGCPEHSGRDSTGPRRVRTQVERDADGVAWRQTADTRPGFATYPQTAPGDPSWWRRTASPIPVTAGQMVSQSAWVEGPPPVDGETCAKWCGYCHLNNGQPETETAGEAHPSTVLGIPADIAVEPPPRLDTSGIGNVLREHLPAIGEALTEMLAPPRRRWWHRLTRRAL